VPPQLRGLYYIYYISQSKYYSAGKENKICFYISFSNRKTNLPPFFFYFFVSILDRSILRRETREEGEVPPSSVQLWSLFSSSSSSSLAAVISSPIISSLVFFFSLRSQRETTHKQKYTQKRSFCFRKDTKIKRGLSVSRFAQRAGREPGTPRSDVRRRGRRKLSQSLFSKHRSHRVYFIKVAPFFFEFSPLENKLTG